jgi:two-component system capsular synthesis response regulator RcsB
MNSSRLSETHSSAKHAKTTVVIADDHPIVLAGLCGLIGADSRFHIVGQAQSPEGLVALLQRHAPDIIITDYNMPGSGLIGDGLALISHLSECFPAVRTLVLTVVSNPAMIEAMYSAGASSVVLKSSAAEEIERALAALQCHEIYRSQVPDGREDSLQSTHGRHSSLLSPREYEVIRLFAGGARGRDIAKRLNRSYKTVSTQKMSAMRKLGAKSDLELIAYCLESMRLQ